MRIIDREPSRPSVARYGSVRSGSTAGFGREANFLATQVEVRANRMNENRPSFGRWNRV